MAFALLVTLSLLGIVLLALVVLVGLIRRRQFSLKRLFGLAALFGLLMLPLVEAGRRGAAMPQPVPLPLDGTDRWVTPPLAKAEWWITLSYGRDDPRRLQGELMLRLFDDTEGTLVASTNPVPYGTDLSNKPDKRVCQFHAIEGHRYRIEVDEGQAKQLARWKCRLNVHLAPFEWMDRLGVP